MTWTSQTVMQAVKDLVCPQGCVKLPAIVKHTQLTNRQVADACRKLVEHGYLARQLYSDNAVKPGCYKLTKLGQVALDEGARLTSGPKGPTGKPKVRADSLRDRAWRTLRIRRKASVPELAGLLLNAGATQAEIQRAQNNLQHYMRALKRAGYVSEMRRERPESRTSNGAKRYLLVRDTGLRAPVPQAGAKVYDPNEEKQYDAPRD